MGRDCVAATGPVRWSTHLQSVDQVMATGLPRDTVRLGIKCQGWSALSEVGLSEAPKSPTRQCRAPVRLP